MVRIKILNAKEKLNDQTLHGRLGLCYWRVVVYSNFCIGNYRVAIAFASLCIDNVCYNLVELP